MHFLCISRKTHINLMDWNYLQTKFACCGPWRKTFCYLIRFVDLAIISNIYWNYVRFLKIEHKLKHFKSRGWNFFCNFVSSQKNTNAVKNVLILLINLVFIEIKRQYNAKFHGSFCLLQLANGLWGQNQKMPVECIDEIDMNDMEFSR